MSYPIKSKITATITLESYTDSNINRKYIKFNRNKY